jgi:hypothetical protein
MAMGTSRSVLPGNLPNNRFGCAAVVVILTGRRSANRVEIRIGGQTTTLTGEALRALIDLVLARASSDFGLVRLPRNAICRLRKAIDQVLGPGEGAALIERGDGEEYRLAMKRAEIKTHVALAPCYIELVERKIISAAEAETLCRLLSRRAAAKLLDGE